MFAIIFLALVLRLINLNQSLWLDESISFFAVKNYGFSGLLTKFIVGDVHPPLYYLLLKLWTSVFGYTEIALRVPSVIAGVLAVYVIYKIGGKLPAIFLAINPLAIYYSQEARMYSLAMLFVTCSAYFFLKKRNKPFLLFFLLAVYTDYLPWLMLPVFLPQSLVTLVFLLPWLPILWQQLQASLILAQNYPLWGQVVGGSSLKSLFLVPIKFVTGRIPFQPIMAPVALIYFWIILRVKNKLLWSWFLIPIILGFLISLKIPIFTYHRFLFVMPAFILLLAVGAKKWSSIFIIFINFITLIIFIANPTYHREDWRSAVTYMKSEPGVAVIPSLAQVSAITYYDSQYPVFDQNNFQLANQSPVYLVRYVQEIFDPNDLERNLLESNGYKNIEQKNFNGVIIWKYVF